MAIPGLGLNNCLASKLSEFHAANDGQYVSLLVQGICIVL